MRSFTLSLTLRFAALISVTTLAVLFIAGWLLQMQSFHNLRLLHEGEAHELAEILERGPETGANGLSEVLEADTDSDAWMFFTEIRDGRGGLLFRSSNLGRVSLVKPDGMPYDGQVRVPELGEVLVSSYREGGAQFIIASPLYAQRAMMKTYRKLGALVFVGVSLAGLGVGFVFSRTTQRPLRLIRETALRINADNLGERVPLPEGKDELSALVALLNQMFDRLQTAVEQNRRFAADASHELKTPLAVIRLHVEKLQAGVASDPEKRALVEEILEEAGHLHQLIDSLLFLARSESGAMRVPFSSHDIAKLVEDIGADASMLAEDAKVGFAVEASGEGRIECDPILVHQMVMNIVSNAVRYSPEGGTIFLSARVSATALVLEVVDEGPGVPEASLEKMFNRFERLSAQDRSDARLIRGGHGLGLPIARAIASLHRGTIRAENRRERKGLRVTMTLPR